MADRPKKGGAGRTSQRGRRAGRGARPSAKSAAVGGNAQNAAVIAASNRNKPPVVIPGRGGGGGSKIILSNLPLDVTEAQVKELFATTIGPLRKVAMSYRANGQSTGVCTVEFSRADDAGRAYTQYNNRLIDGKKPLKVEVVVDPAKVAAAPAAAPKGPKGAAAAGAAKGKGGRTAAGASTRGRGRARGAKREARPKKTVEDLDAEMEDYNKQATTDAAPAA
ncbi:RNA annealing protein YRA1 [Pseudozyma hubeiensis]|nr:RNA annealing protein YRA1 [Pseudozyma hubeiensis]